MTTEREDTEARVRRTFDTVASTYDHPGASWFDRTAQALVEAARLQPGMSALDLASGTGKVALALAASEPRARVVGVDLSEGMVAQAKQKAQKLALTNVRFDVGSFDTLSYGPNFDLVTCSFGVFFVNHMAEALTRFGEQLRPGGRLLLSTFSLGSFEPFSGLFLKLYGSYGFETPPPPWLRIATKHGLVELFGSAGLREPAITEYDFGFELPDASAWWDIVYNAGYRGMLQRLAPEDVEPFRARHCAEVLELIERQGKRRLDIRVLVASVTK